jgi:phage tail protein X
MNTVLIYQQKSSNPGYATYVTFWRSAAQATRPDMSTTRFKNSGSAQPRS